MDGLQMGNYLSLGLLVFYFKGQPVSYQALVSALGQQLCIFVLSCMFAFWSKPIRKKMITNFEQYLYCQRTFVRRNLGSNRTFSFLLFLKFLEDFAPSKYDISFYFLSIHLVGYNWYERELISMLSRAMEEILVSLLKIKGTLEQNQQRYQNLQQHLKHIRSSHNEMQKLF